MVGEPFAVCVSEPYAGQPSRAAKQSGRTARQEGKAARQETRLLRSRAATAVGFRRRWAFDGFRDSGTVSLTELNDLTPIRRDRTCACGVMG